jgi:hypothetical protein
VQESSSKLITIHILISESYNLIRAA